MSCKTFFVHLDMIFFYKKVYLLSLYIIYQRFFYTKNDILPLFRDIDIECI